MKIFINLLNLTYIYVNYFMELPDFLFSIFYYKTTMKHTTNAYYESSTQHKRV